MSLLHRRATALVGVLAASSLVLSACGGGSDEESSSASGSGDEPVTLDVGLFGTFGFKEAGLYEDYNIIQVARQSSKGFRPNEIRRLVVFDAGSVEFHGPGSGEALAEAVPVVLDGDSRLADAHEKPWPSRLIM